MGGLVSCQDSPKESTATYDVGLVESKKIVLPVDENTYYLSKSMFQFEEDEKEYEEEVVEESFEGVFD